MRLSTPLIAVIAAAVLSVPLAGVVWAAPDGPGAVAVLDGAAPRLKVLDVPTSTAAPTYPGAEPQSVSATATAAASAGSEPTSTPPTSAVATVEDPAREPQSTPATAEPSTSVELPCTRAPIPTVEAEPSSVLARPEPASTQPSSP